MTKRISTKKIFQKGRILIKDTNIKLDDNKNITFQFWDKADTVMIVPLLKNGNIAFIREYQVTLDAEMISLPKGRVEKNENLLEIANKELQEEVGYKANSLVKIGTVSICPGYISGKTHIYLARNLVKSKLEGDEIWKISIFEYPLKNFEKLIDEGKLFEARMITALYELKRYLKKPL
jgi:8-oxo-dGTP pyrophosphatase MutT (NUDIX family)